MISVEIKCLATTDDIRSTIEIRPKAKGETIMDESIYVSRLISYLADILMYFKYFYENIGDL